MEELFTKLSSSATIPTRAHAGDAGYDLYADLSTDEKELLVVLAPMERRLVPTGVRVHLPSGTYARVAPRSGLAVKYGIDVLAGVIDRGFEAPIQVLLINFGTENYEIRHGDRIAQLIVTRLYVEDEHPTSCTFNVDVACSTRGARGENGFGSSGI